MYSVFGRRLSAEPLPPCLMYFLSHKLFVVVVPERKRRRKKNLISEKIRHLDNTVVYTLPMYNFLIFSV